MPEKPNLPKLLNPATPRPEYAERAKRRGQYTSLVVYDRENRGADFVENVLLAAGLYVEIQDEGEPVTLLKNGL